ncbi:transposase [Euzebya sp.]|uniref:transposase n=1 Tax=Euzebya sp. TaxID=1971409 RepID=UPI0035159192
MVLPVRGRQVPLDDLDVTNSSADQPDGIADVGAATIIAIVGDVSRFPTAGHFAACCGTAPLEASSGDVVRHRLSRTWRSADEQGAARRSLPGPQRRSWPRLLPPQDR